jgi:hypothetical protein
MLLMFNAQCISYHGHNLGLHFPYSRKDIGMNWVGHSELAKRFRLKPYQLLATVIYCSANSAVLPFSMFHVGQLAQLLAHLLFAPSCAGQAGDALDAGAAGNKFALELEQ